MAERSKAAVLKTVSGETRSGVRIPVPPPERPVRAVLAERRGFRRSSAPWRSRFGLESPSLCDCTWVGLPQALIGSLEEPLRARIPVPLRLHVGRAAAGAHRLLGGAASGSNPRPSATARGSGCRRTLEVWAAVRGAALLGWPDWRSVQFASQSASGVCVQLHQAGLHRLQDPEHLIPGILRKRESGFEPRPDTSRNRNGDFANVARRLYSRCRSSDLRWWRRGADKADPRLARVAVALAGTPRLHHDTGSRSRPSISLKSPGLWVTSGKRWVLAVAAIHASSTAMVLVRRSHRMAPHSRQTSMLNGITT